MEADRELRKIWLSSLRLFFIVVVAMFVVVWSLRTPGGLLGKADTIGYAVCHRIDLHSFYLGERQLPLCARCTGMYLGAMVGLIYQIIMGKKRSGSPPITVALVLIFLTIAFVVDGVNSFLNLIPPAFSLYESHNALRLVTGTGMGIVLITVLFPAFRQTVWRNIDRLPIIRSLREFGGLLICAFLVDLLVLTENTLILYPLALVSSAGVVVLLTMVYTMVWLMVLRKDNQINKHRELFFPMVVGFTVSLIQLALLDLGRYWLTGTWEGFHLG